MLGLSKETLLRSLKRAKSQVEYSHIVEEGLAGDSRFAEANAQSKVSIYWENAVIELELLCDELGINY